MTNKAHVVIFVEGAGQVYVKGFGADALIASLNIGVIRQKRASALNQLEQLLGVPHKKC